MQRTKKLTTAKEIQKHIEKTPLKTILFSEDFKEYGGAEAVKSALHRMVKTGGLKRLAKGIYVKPGYSELIKKETVPDLEEVAAAQEEEAVDIGEVVLNPKRATKKIF